MKKWVLFLLFLPSPLLAGNLISSATWTEDGGYKMAQQDRYPTNGSTGTISRIWDGTNIKLFGGRGEFLTWVTYLNAGNSNATNVMVSLSSFTGMGTALGSGITSIQVSSTSVWDFTKRPYALYRYNYVQEIGMSQIDIAWDPTEYDEQQLPTRWRVPCTLNGNNQCPPNGGTNLFTSRADENKFYPDAAVPIEEYQISSFTVNANTSQAIGGEVYISTALPAGTYKAVLTVTEGVSVSTTIPVQLLVYNVLLPPTGTLPVIADLGYADLDMRLTGTRFPTNEQVDPYLTNHARAAAFLHRHKVIAIGDPNTPGQDFPNTEYLQHLNGNGYKETYGLAYNTSPGYGVKDPFYMIGTYGSWASGSWSITQTGGTNGFCTNLSSWTFYCNNNNLTCALYTNFDEASQANLAGAVNTESTWASTAPACANGGNTTPFFQTGSLPTVLANAPNAKYIFSTSWMGVSSATWINDEGVPGYTRGGYNSSVGVDSILNIQEDGLGSREPLWGAYKTNQKYWFLWEINYWNDANNGGQTQNGFNANTNNDNDMFNLSKDFGYDAFPSTNAVKGHTGFHFTNGDGNMLYYATDSVYANPNFGFNGVIGSWRLNMLTRGIQDVDLINQAFAINPALTTSIVNGQVQDVMYLRQCFTLADCSYSYGPRPWNQNENSWELARESLEQIIAGTPVNPLPQTIFNGPIHFQGTITFTP